MTSASLASDAGAQVENNDSTFTTYGHARTERMRWFQNGLIAQLRARGYEYRPGEVDAVRLVLNFTDRDDPQSFRRKAQAIFVCGIIEADEEPDDVLRTIYSLMVRTMSNVMLYVVNIADRIDAHFMTMEQGHYVVSKLADEPDDAFFAEIFDRLEPLANSRLVINNIYVPDLPENLWQGDEITAQLSEAGRKLDAMKLLPAPFPIHEMLSERDLRHVKRLFGMGGLSYGNLSARKDELRFWMSASGVNKAQLNEIGRDILLVTDYDPSQNAMVLSVPPNIEPRRVSVDAIEHFMIYREHPSVGAIIHVHAWMDGIESTHINFPCGTRELAIAVSELVRRAPDPSRAVVGLRNHGLTITGHSLPEIFERMEGRIIPQVPMS
jgi:hypothetical protein